MILARVTTVDNPYDPFDQFPQWYAFDVNAGHDTAALLARLTFSSSELSESDQARSTELAVDTIVKEDWLGLYRKVTREVDDD